MKPQIGFFSELLDPNLIINIAQLVSPSVALPAELVLYILFTTLAVEFGVGVELMTITLHNVRYSSNLFSKREIGGPGTLPF